MPATASTPSRLDGRAAPLPSRTLVLLLSLLMGLQPVTTDLYLPALPAMADGFGVPVAQVQFTLSALLLCFGISQLFWGPLSDRFGRKPVLLAGLAAYVVSAVACALAPSLGWLVLGRMVQGAAMGAAVMTARAVVRDVYEPAEGARAMSKAFTGLGIVACLSAPVGGLLSQALGWRAALAALAVFSAFTLGAMVLRFEETLRHRRLNALEPAELLRTWLRILRHPRFVAFSVVASASNAGLFTYLATSSFVLIRIHGASPVTYGLCMASMSLCYLSGTIACRRLLHRVGLQATVDLGAGLSLASALLLAVLYLSGVHSLWAIVLPVNLFMASHGMLQPGCQNGAITAFPQAAGTAAALNGFCMMMTSFLMGTWLGRHMDGTATPLVQGMVVWGSVVALGGWVMVRRMALRGARA